MGVLPHDLSAFSTGKGVVNPSFVTRLEASKMKVVLEGWAEQSRSTSTRAGGKSGDRRMCSGLREIELGCRTRGVVVGEIGIWISVHDGVRARKIEC